MKEHIQIYGITIDPSGASDLDDGLAYHRASHRKEVIHIAITNVASSIDARSPLFQKARDRIETRYFVTRPHMPMTSSEIEANHSLTEGKMCPAMILTITLRAGQIDNYKLRAGTFCSRRQLTYSEANQILQSPQQPTRGKQVVNTLRGLQSFKNRYLNGAISESKLSDNIYGHRAKGEEHGSSSYQLVSFYMKLASILITQLAAQHKIPLIHRNHGAMHTTKGANGQFERQIIYLPKRESVGRVVVLKATYGATPLGHYDMQLTAYSRNTSPLRRLEDLINQQQLYAYVRGIALPWSYKQIHSMGIDIDLKHDDQEKKITQYLHKLIEQNTNLDYLESRMFNHMIMLAIKKHLRSEIIEEVKQQIIKRMELRTLLEVDYLYVLYRAPADTWSTIQQQLLAMLQKDGNWRSRIYNVLDRLQEHTSFDIRTYREQKQWHAQAVITIGKREHMLKTYRADTKRTAQRKVIKATVFDLYNLKNGRIAL